MMKRGIYLTVEALLSGTGPGGEPLLASVMITPTADGSCADFVVTNWTQASPANPDPIIDEIFLIWPDSIPKPFKSRPKTLAYRVGRF